MDRHDTPRFSPRPNRAHEIDWRPWGQAAFAEALALQRPILLSLSATWCHWCHVMDETTYSTAEIIAAINDGFVPIRVDNDRRPDVNRRYNLGGWPTTAFLAANGDVIAGGTYVPPAQMLETLRRVTEFFAANREALLALTGPGASGADTSEERGAHVLSDELLPEITPSDLDAVIDAVADAALAAADPDFGGFGREPKFPQPDLLAFALLLSLGSDERAERARDIATRTLTTLPARPIFDATGGGFFRYSTQRDWSVPHYEKMLDDNARLALVYLDAAALAAAPDAERRPAVDEDLLRSTAAATLDYLVAALWSDQFAAFAGSQDADEEYYALGAGDRRLRPAPLVDQTVYAGANALAARALIRGAELLDRPDLLEKALRLLARFIDRREHGAVSHYVLADGTWAAQAPLLSDQAHVAAACLDAYEATAEWDYLERAAEIMHWTLDHLGDTDGRLNDRLVTPDDSAGLLGRALPADDENGTAADVLLRLSAYTGDPGTKVAAERLLAAWASHLGGGQAISSAATLGSAALRARGAAAHVVIVGATDDPRAQALHKAALRAPHPLTTVQSLDPAQISAVERLLAMAIARPSQPTAYRCSGASCQQPITDPDELAAELRDDFLG